MEQTQKQKNGFMMKLATFIVDKRNLFLLITIILLAFLAFSRNWVEVENDQTAYLPASCETKQALNVMSDQFTTYGTAEVMVANITYDEAEALSGRIGAVKGVQSVAFDETSGHYARASALFTVTFDRDETDDACLTSLDAVKELLADYDLFVSTNLGNTLAETIDSEVSVIMVYVAVIIVAVLILTSRTCGEVPALLLTFIAAMVFMRFKIDPDMGICLMKSILFALLAVFIVMPGLLVLFVPLIEKTEHRSWVPKISFAGRYAWASRKVAPFVFLTVIAACFFLSGKCPYAYGYSNLTTPKLNETQIAEKLIDETFTTPNMLAFVVPAGDYEKETALLTELESRGEIDHAVGLANTEAMDGYMLADKLTPRQFSELAGLDYEMAQVIYAAEQGDYGKLMGNIASYKVLLIDTVRTLAQSYYPDGNVYVAGDSTNEYDFQKSFARDNTVVSIVSILIVLVVLFTFLSAGMPVLLILVIQGSIWINFSISAVLNQPLFFMSYLVVRLYPDGREYRLCHRYRQPLSGAQKHHVPPRRHDRDAELRLPDGHHLRHDSCRGRNAHRADDLRGRHRRHRSESRPRHDHLNAVRAVRSAADSAARRRTGG